MQGKTFTMELAGKTLTIETGKYCEQAGGSAFVRMATPWLWSMQRWPSSPGTA